MKQIHPRLDMQKAFVIIRIISVILTFRFYVPPPPRADSEDAENICETSAASSRGKSLFIF
jgi:hypothetical protein